MEKIKIKIQLITKIKINSMKDELCNLGNVHKKLCYELIFYNGIENFVHNLGHFMFSMVMTFMI